MSRGPEMPTHTEFATYADILGEIFINRWDMYHFQIDDGTYRAAKKPLTRQLLTGHLKGSTTLGAYMMNRQSQAREVVFDADTDDQLQQLWQAAPQMVIDGLYPYFERSRRGGHVRIFLGEYRPGSQVRKFASGILAAYDIPEAKAKTDAEGIEVYPAQEKLRITPERIGPGSFVRLPFGIHKISGERYGVYHPSGDPIANTIRGQITALREPLTPSEAVFGVFLRRGVQEALEAGLIAPKPEEKGSFKRTSERATVSERIKASMRTRDFINRYFPEVRLGESNKGFCPIHDDRHTSFGLFYDHDENMEKWNCFAGCGSGTIIDLWMQVNQVDFKTAITELADMLLD